MRRNNQHQSQHQHNHLLPLSQTHHLHHFATSLCGPKYIALTSHFLSSLTLTNLCLTAMMMHQSYLPHNLKTQHTHLQPIKPLPFPSMLWHPKQPPILAHQHLNPHDLAQWQLLDQLPCLCLGPTMCPPSPAKRETSWMTSYVSTRSWLMAMDSWNSRRWTGLYS